MGLRVSLLVVNYINCHRYHTILWEFNSLVPWCFLFFYIDHQLPALWQLRGLVGSRSSDLWDVARKSELQMFWVVHAYTVYACVRLGMSRRGWDMTALPPSFAAGHYSCLFVGDSLWCLHLLICSVPVAHSCDDGCFCLDKYALCMLLKHRMYSHAQPTSHRPYVCLALYLCFMWVRVFFTWSVGH